MMDADIRKLLRDHGQLAAQVETLGADEDLFSHGLSSLATVNLMLALEEEFDIEIPDEMLNRRSFRSIAAITEMVDSLRAKV